MKRFMHEQGRIIFLMGALLGGSVVYGKEDSWTWLHQKIFSEAELQENASKRVTMFSKEGVEAFTQLVFSWNAFRDTGHYSFWVKSRNAKTKRWTDWYKMMEWGDGVQRSYDQPGDGKTQYKHVRLETGNQSKADGFRIKIMAHAGADLSMVKSFAVSISDFGKFKPEQIKDGVLKLPSVSIKSVPKMAQYALAHPRNGGFCSPTSCSMLTSYLSDQRVDPVDFANKVFDSGLNVYGSWPFNMAHAFERCDGLVWFATARFNSFKNLHTCLTRGIPVVVSVRGHLQGAPKVYSQGHLLLVVGWNARTKKVICHDPAHDHAEKTLKHYPITSFLRAWERSHRLTYVAEPAVKKIS